MTALIEHGMETSIATSVLSHSIQTALDSNVPEAIERLALFLARYPDNSYLQGALLYYLEHPDSQAPSSPARSASIPTPHQLRDALSRNDPSQTLRELLIEVPASAANSLALIERFAPANMQVATISRFDGRSDLLHIMVTLTPSTLASIASFLLSCIQSRAAPKIKSNSSMITIFEPDTVVPTLLQLAQG